MSPYYLFWGRVLAVILAVTLPLALVDAEPVVRSALQAEQFGVITEVDFRARFREAPGAMLRAAPR